MEVGRLRVLLVEDNELDARAMLRLLDDDRQTDFEIVRCADLAGALDLLADDGFDCVLLDLSLPDSSGLASIDALLERSPKSPVVVLTGLDDPSVAVEAVERGAQDFLTKKDLAVELVGRSIRYAVARHHGDMQLQSAHQVLERMEDRERIARDLHDTVIQQLFAIGLGLQAVVGRIDDDAVRGRLIESVDGIDGAIRHLREAIFGLQSAGGSTRLSDDILRVAEAERAALGFAPTVRVGPSVDELDADVGDQVVATLREALSNVARHARASATQVIVDVRGDEVVLEVTDNGIGFDVDAVRQREDALNRHGLRNMEARAAGLSGRFRVGMGAGGGTTLEWRASTRRAER